MTTVNSRHLSGALRACAQSITEEIGGRVTDKQAA